MLPDAHAMLKQRSMAMRVRAAIKAKGWLLFDAFNSKFDADKNGLLSPGEVFDMLRYLRIDLAGLTPADVLDWIDAVDQDSDGNVSYTEFVDALRDPEGGSDDDADDDDDAARAPPRVAPAPAPPRSPPPPTTTTTTTRRARARSRARDELARRRAVPRSGPRGRAREARRRAARRGARAGRGRRRRGGARAQRDPRVGGRGRREGGPRAQPGGRPLRARRRGDVALRHGPPPARTRSSRATSRTSSAARRRRQQGRRRRGEGLLQEVLDERPALARRARDQGVGGAAGDGDGSNSRLLEEVDDLLKAFRGRPDGEALLWAEVERRFGADGARAHAEGAEGLKETGADDKDEFAFGDANAQGASVPDVRAMEQKAQEDLDSAMTGAKGDGGGGDDEGGGKKKGGKSSEGEPHEFEKKGAAVLQNRYILVALKDGPDRDTPARARGGGAA